MKVRVNDEVIDTESPDLTTIGTWENDPDSTPAWCEESVYILDDGRYLCVCVGPLVGPCTSAREPEGGYPRLTCILSEKEAREWCELSGIDPSPIDERSDDE
jgi:hypothetical protein